MLMAIMFAGCFEEDNNESSEALINGLTNVTGWGFSGDYVAWSQERDDGKYVYAYDINHEKKITIAEKLDKGYFCDIYRHIIVYVIINGDFADIKLYDIDTKETINVDENVDRTSLAISPKIYNDRIVWFEQTSHSPGGPELCNLMLYSISNKEITIQIENIDSWRGLEIFEDYVIYVHDGYSNVTIFNIENGSNRQLPIHNTTHIKFYGKNVVFQETTHYDDYTQGKYKTCTGSYDEHLFLYNLDDGLTKQLTTYENERGYPTIYQNKIAWTKMNNGYRNVCIYDIESGEEELISEHKIHQYAPKIWENKVVWIEHITEEKENIVYHEL